MMKFFHSVAIRLTLIFLIVALFGCFHDSDDDTSQENNNTLQNPSPSAGVWPGTWINTTFISQGPLTLDITDNGDDTLTVTFDIDGMVGGSLDPDPQTVTATVDANGDTSFSGMIDMAGMPGQLDFTLTKDGVLTISLPSIPPSVGLLSFTATGTMTSTDLSLNYEVFLLGGSAVGTVTATKS